MQRSFGPSLGAAFLAALLVHAPAAAEPLSQGARQVAQAVPPQQQGRRQGKPQATEAGAQQPNDDADLKQRVEQLEEQLVDMQVLVGTLETLARGGGAAPAPRGNAGAGSGNGADDLRVDGLQTQVRALAAQLQQLTVQVRALARQPLSADAAAPTLAQSGDSEASAEPPPARFGSTTVTAGADDAIGGLLDGQAGAQTAPATAAPAAQEMAAAPPALVSLPGAPDTTSAKQLYETAYGYLMQRDYGAAQSAFEQFLNRYPKDSLAGNAQYWLGEAHFVRGEYKAAAGAFLKGYQDYAGNARAADSLLKLAMSLDRLGQKDAACTSFSELKTRFPDAPDNVKSRAKIERNRIGCE
jgi:tol-pal system protein YbgF